MAGLLYKDFVAIHGKIYASVLLAATLLVAVCSIAPVSEDVIIVVGVSVVALSMMLPMVVMLSIESGIIMADAGARRKAYLLGLPVNKKQYVASKYIFILICYYVILSVTVIWAQFINAPMEAVLGNTMVMDTMSLLPLWVQACLLVSAIELPFFIAVGVKAGNGIKTSILFVLMFVIFGYMLFGDITFLEEFDLGSMLARFEEHMEITMTLQVLGPVLAGGVYYLSYRIAATLFGRKEREDEE